MSEDQVYDLGQDPKRLNDMGREDKMQYPCAYDINPENFPPMKSMRLGDVGEAVIHFKVKGGGIEIRDIQLVSSESEDDSLDREKVKKDQKTLLKRSKKNQFQPMGESGESPSEGY